MIISILEWQLSYWIDYSDRGAEVLTITQEDFQKIQSGLATFDIETREVVDVPQPDPVETAPQVPQSITPLQVRLAMIHSWIDPTTIDTVLDSIDDVNEKLVAKYMWEYANEFKRDNAMILSLAPVLWLSSEDIDNLFILWSTLS